MSKWKQEKGVTLSGTIVAVILILIFAGLNFSKDNEGIMKLAGGVVEEYNVSVILEEVELAIGEMQIEYYYEKYVNDNSDIADTFGGYITQKLKNEGIITSKGKVISEDATTVIYENKQGRKIAQGTFNEETGEINIDSLITENFANEE